MNFAIQVFSVRPFLVHMLLTLVVQFPSSTLLAILESQSVQVETQLTIDGRTCTFPFAVNYPQPYPTVSEV